MKIRKNQAGTRLWVPFTYEIKAFAFIIYPIFLYGWVNTTRAQSMSGTGGGAWLYVR